MELDFPSIEVATISGPAGTLPPIAKPTALAVATVTVKQAALAKFTQTEKDLRTLAERYRDVAFDCSTPKGLKEAKEARHDLRENGRFAVQRVRDATKDALNSAKTDVETEAERLIAIVKPIEDGADKQIKAREDEIKREAEKEAARKKVHTDAIALIVGYAEQGRGKGSAALAKAIAFVETIDVSEAVFEEFEPAAAAAKERTLEALRGLHAKALDDERIRAENEARQKALRLIGQINAHVAEGIGENSEALAQRLVSLKALAPEGGVSDDVVTAILTASTQLYAMYETAKRSEDMERQLAEMRAAQAPAPAPASVPRSADEMEHAEAVQRGADDVVTADMHDEEDEPPLYAPLRPAPVQIVAVLPTDGPIPSEAEARLIAAEALARRHGAMQVGPDRFVFSVASIADLIDAARA